MPAPPDGPAASASATALTPPPVLSPDAAPSAVPASALPAMPGEPPAGMLAGLADGASAQGQLGSYTWAGNGTDAPWIVVPEPLGASVGAPLTATFGAIVPLTWTAAWARVAGGIAGDPRGGTTGSGIVAVDAPSATGDWSLCITAWFGPGANATYYWRLALAP
jgi:hypothetical protein